MIREEEHDWYDEDIDMLCHAMLKAREAFMDYFDELGIDAAYFELEMTGYVTSVEFERLERVDMDFDYREDGGENDVLS